MDGVFPAKRFAFPLAPAGAGLLGAIAGLAVLAAPTALLESFAVDSGIAAVVAAAQPPLGLTARAALTVLAAGGVFVFAWVLLDLLGPGRTLTVPVRTAREAREPVRATRDLGVPFLEVSAGQPRPRTAVPADVERDIPEDLDLPLAFYDPGAVPSVPADPVPLVPALARKKPESDEQPAPDVHAKTMMDVTPEPVAPAEAEVPASVPAPPPAPMPPLDLTIIAPAPRVAASKPTIVPTVLESVPAAPEPVTAPAAERWEVVALPTPPVTRAPERTERPSEATIQALLARLERGVAQKAAETAARTPQPARQPAAPAPAWPSLDDTLGELRALAAARG